MQDRRWSDVRRARSAGSPTTQRVGRAKQNGRWLRPGLHRGACRRGREWKLEGARVLDDGGCVEGSAIGKSKTSLLYSSRIASMGSTDAARPAGNTKAMASTASNSASVT